MNTAEAASKKHFVSANGPVACQASIRAFLRRAASFAVGVLLAGMAGPTCAEILSLDCSENGIVALNVWVDLDKSSVTVRGAARPGLPLRTYVAHITPTSIGSAWSNSGKRSRASIDRRTGTFYETYVDTGGASESSGPYQCTKVSTPPPAAKF